MQSFTYRWIPDFVRSKERMLARLKIRSQDLDLIPWDVARLDQFDLDFGHWPGSWLCFALGDPSVVERENLGEACYRWVGVGDSTATSG